jgi:hypothetical protein
MMVEAIDEGRIKWATAYIAFACTLLISSLVFLPLSKYIKTQRKGSIAGQYIGLYRNENAKTNINPRLAHLLFKTPTNC